jgi:glucose-1-phosphate adenylyltransferase
VIENSIIGIRCTIGENVTIRNSVIFGNDLPDSGEEGPRSSEDAVSIGSGSVIDGAIVDKNARIGRNSRIINERQMVDSEEIDGRAMIRDGVSVVFKDATLPDGWSLQEKVSSRETP